jgi:hypothetical protein
LLFRWRRDALDEERAGALAARGDIAPRYRRNRRRSVLRLSDDCPLLFARPRAHTDEWLVERMNRTLKEALTLPHASPNLKRTSNRSYWPTTLPSGMLRGLTAYEHICKLWTTQFGSG